MKKTILTGIATAALAFSASAEVKVGNPMAVTGPIPDLVAPMVLAVDLAAQHVNEQGGLFLMDRNIQLSELTVAVILQQQLTQ